MPSDDGQALYELENQNEALHARVTDLERVVVTLRDFIYQKVPLPAAVVKPYINLAADVLDRDLSSYRS